MESKLEVLLSLKDEASAKLKKFQDATENLGSIFKTAAVAGTAAFAGIAAVLYSSAKASMEAAAVQTRLEQILRTSTDASDAQIESLNKQAEALERVGVVSADVIRQGQGQLASFDLQAESIERLIPSILNYAVAEKGMNMSAEELQSVTNGLAQAMQGKFKSLEAVGFILDSTTKKLISHGTESQRVAQLIKVLDSTYGGLNEKMRTTAAGGVLGLRFEMDKLRQTIGDQIMPVINKLINIITPVVAKITDWIQQHPRLTNAIIVTAGIISGLIAILGILGLGFLAAKAAAISLGTTIYALLGPIGWVVGAISVLGIGAGIMAFKMTDAKDATIDLSKAAEGTNKKMGDLGNGIEESGKKAAATAKKIKELKKDIKDLMEESVKQEADSRKQMAEAFVEQEQVVADASKEFNEKKSELNKAIAEKDAADKIASLRAETYALEEKLIKERDAITANREYFLQLDVEYTEAKRRASLTEFQRKVEDIVKEQKLNREATTKKIKEKQDEIDALIKEEKRYTAGVLEENARQIASYNEVARARRSGGASGSWGDTLPVGNANSTPAYIGKRAQGGNVAKGSSYMVGENGPELFTPTAEGVINRNSGSGINLVININGGTYLDRNVAHEIGDMIIDEFKKSSRI